MNDKKLFFTYEKSEVPYNLADINKKLYETLKKGYVFDTGFIPDNFNIAFLLISEDREDVKKDKWKAVFYKETRKIKGTITLDTIDELSNTTETYYEVFKEVAGNFEDMIEIATDLIKSRLAKKKKMGLEEDE